MVYHPWRELRGMPEWLLIVHPLPAGQHAEVHWATHTITMAPGLTQAQRRSALAHELQHIERGPFLAWLEPREEAIVDALAARKLITLEALADALAWSGEPHEVADELWVDLATVRARLRALTPDERAHLEQRLES